MAYSWSRRCLMTSAISSRENIPRTRHSSRSCQRVEQSGGGEGRGRAGAAARESGTEPSRSEEHTSELRSLMRSSYAVFCLKKKNTHESTHVRTEQQHT